MLELIINESKLQIMLKENMNKMNATVEGIECNEKVNLIEKRFFGSLLE